MVSTAGSVWLPDAGWGARAEIGPHPVFWVEAGVDDAVHVLRQPATGEAAASTPAGAEEGLAVGVLRQRQRTRGLQAHQVQVVKLHAVGVGLRKVHRDLHAAHFLRPFLDAVLDDERVPALGTARITHGSLRRGPPQQAL